MKLKGGTDRMTSDKYILTASRHTVFKQSTASHKIGPSNHDNAGRNSFRSPHISFAPAGSF